LQKVLLLIVSVAVTNRKQHNKQLLAKREIALSLLTKESDSVMAIIPPGTCGGNNPSTVADTLCCLAIRGGTELFEQTRLKG
jgi:hypothetical protein